MGAPESDNKALVRRFISQAFNAGELAIVDELLAADYVLRAAPEVRGPEEMKHFVMLYRTAFPDYACASKTRLPKPTKWSLGGRYAAPTGGSSWGSAPR